ncbi:MAG: conjugal transfer protein TraX [Defluviitaleaceae bacterium]|nr:conjugal transfer protein TraX [Defluviitaleaceae bacterium]
MTSFNLKLIALATMLIDHTGLALSSIADTFFMRVIGRVAFPVFAFLIAEGCRNTSDIRKYMLRLGIFALISEIPFDLLRSGRIFDPTAQNIFFTLFLGVAAIWLYECAMSKNLPWALGIFACIPFAVVAYLMKTDYAAYGVMAIFVCYVFKTRFQQAAALGLVMFLLYQQSILSLAVIPALLLILLYNGRLGIKMKMAFYIVYPTHLLALAYIRYFVII